jgi:hypothetical protein
MALLSLLASGCGQTPTAPPTDKGDKITMKIPAGRVTGFYTKNVIYRVDEDITIGMPNLNADIQVYEPNQPFIPANRDDYVVRVHTGDFVIDQDAMAQIFNKYELTYPGCPLSDLSIEAKQGKLKMSGTLRKGIPLPFEMEGALRPNGKGQIVLTPESVKSAGIPVKGLMNIIGLEVANLMNSRPNGGMKIDGNDIVIYPDKLLPAPAVIGFVSGVRVEPGKVIMVFDDQVRRDVPPLPEPWAQNWILMHGGNVLINNNLAIDAIMHMIDSNPKDPMHYYMPLYREQLEAGFTVATKNSTIAYIPDVYDIYAPLPRFRPQMPGSPGTY